MARLATSLQSGTYKNLEVAIGANDTPFVTVVYSSNRVRGIKINPATRAIQNAASSNDVYGAANKSEHLSIAMSSTGVPNICFKRTQAGDSKAYVGRRNASNAWEILAGGAASEGTADWGQVAVDGSGNPYIIFSDYFSTRAGKATVRRYNGASWETVGTAGFTAGVVSRSDIAIDQSTGDVYIAYADEGDGNKLFVKKWTGSAWASVFDSTIAPSAASISMYLLNGVPYVVYKDGSNSDLASAVRYGPSRIWTGGTSTNWADANNWAGKDVPEDGDAVTFKPSPSNEPTTPTGTNNFRSLSIQSTDTLSIASGSVLAVNGDLIVNGTTTGDGSIQLNSSLGAQTISGVGTVHNLELNNSNGAAIEAGDTLKITGTYTPTSGVLTTNSGLKLKSTASGTARVAAGVGTYISGTVIVERFIPGGRRAMRYFSHPFTTALALNQLTGTGEIDITGTGGGANGFTGTSTNAASSWWYDPVTGDESTISDPGWTTFTTTAGGGVNSWNRHQAIKVLVRGTKGQGLTTTSYTPSAATVNMTGSALNQGDQIVTLTKGTISGYNLIGNPFPSQIDLNATVRDVNIEPNFWVWNPNGGTKGIFEANPFSLSYYLPAYSGFFARTTNNIDNTITFQEANKVSNTPASLFKTTGAAPLLTEIRIEDSSNVFWDKFMLIIDSNSNASKEVTDAAKFFNSEMNFYSLS